jgi:hypothetical protein
MNFTLDTKVATTVESALRESKGTIHAFLSGGGLRVLRLETPRRGKLLGYGEHPYVAEAFRILTEDFAAGGRPYGSVYGTVEEHYITGDSTPQDDLDAWVRRGNSFDVFCNPDGKFVFELRGFQDNVMPEDLKVRATAGETVRWTSDRGVTYEATPFVFPGNGERGCSISAVSRPEHMAHHRVWMWRTVRRGVGDTLTAALSAAFEAPHEEYNDD